MPIDGRDDDAPTGTVVAPDGGDPTDEPADAEVVRAAASAAESVVFARYDAGEVDDVDVTVTFEDGVLDVDVYVSAPDARPDEDRVADDAALAARSAVDDLF